MSAARRAKASDDDGFPFGGGQGGRRAFFEFDAALLLVTAAALLRFDCIVVVQSTLTINVERNERILLLLTFGTESALYVKDVIWCRVCLDVKVRK